MLDVKFTTFLAFVFTRIKCIEKYDALKSGFHIFFFYILRVDYVYSYVHINNNNKHFKKIIKSVDKY